MPLSEEELRLLEQMERALVEEDPKLASTLRGTSFQRSARRRAILGGVILVAGVALMVSGLLYEPFLGVAGFLVMLGGAVLAVTAMRAPTAPFTPRVRDTRHTGLGVVDGGRRSRRHHQRSSHSFMERVEQRWRHRRERGF